MPEGKFKTEAEIRKLLTIVRYLVDNEDRGGSIPEFSGMEGLILWILGDDEDALEHSLGDISCIYGKEPIAEEVAV